MKVVWLMGVCALTSAVACTGTVTSEDDRITFAGLTGTVPSSAEAEGFGIHEYEVAIGDDALDTRVAIVGVDGTARGHAIDASLAEPGLTSLRWLEGMPSPSLQEVLVRDVESAIQAVASGEGTPLAEDPTPLSGDVCDVPVATAYHKVGPVPAYSATSVCAQACYWAMDKLQQECDEAFGCCMTEVVHRYPRYFAAPGTIFTASMWECTCAVAGYRNRPRCPEGASFDWVMEECTCPGNAILVGDTCTPCPSDATAVWNICDCPGDKEHRSGACLCPSGTEPSSFDSSVCVDDDSAPCDGTCTGGGGGGGGSSGGSGYGGTYDSGGGGGTSGSVDPCPAGTREVCSSTCAGSYCGDWECECL